MKCLTTDTSAAITLRISMHLQPIPESVCSPIPILFVSASTVLRQDFWMLMFERGVSACTLTVSDFGGRSTGFVAWRSTKLEAVSACRKAWHICSDLALKRT